jgi:hypothetical protein
MQPPFDGSPFCERARRGREGKMQAINELIEIRTKASCLAWEQKTEAELRMQTGGLQEIEQVWHLE